MKTLLVYPEFPKTYWSFRHALSFEGKCSAFPPLGLLTMSSMLPCSWDREKFAEVVRLAAVGYHFRKLTED
jgi:hypothetical protein